ncbi:NAD(P)H-dependent glycerol-3-phosphate dehydrogenase [Rhabdaerophilum sp. SD176]|uniref:NAD(P)H-dependent glycerol-3-phosphate dehydrogenase n=1 Tax=Rhabdaerophilum sp. SD176 TaxID=2983548 RepID=UPI0024DFB8C3|nr:NAD(P)H-dependent glycerol-3-phosphate dehydrogenase [Rhabdaerophilum sp. SD176]
MKGNRVSVIGAGAFGTALALAFRQAGREVTLWGRDAEAMAALDAGRDLGALFPGASLPTGIRATADLSEAVLAGILVMAVPTQALRQVSEAVALVLPQGRAVISAAKGMEQRTGAFATEILAETLGAHRFGILSGPSFAADIARGLPTAIALAMADATDAEALARFLSSPGLRLYHTTDIRGVEIGGAAKNVLAIAAGIVAGLGLGDSARAAMITRGFAELQRFARAYGARPETLMGLSGLGDLVLTASSPQSRNYALGLALGQGRTPREAIGSGKLAEGAFTAAILAESAKARGLEMPIVDAVTAILEERLSVGDAVRHLMARPLRGE